MTRLRIIDFEGNGTEPPAELIEYGFCDLWRAADGEPWVVGDPVSRLFGITAPLDPQARAIHHITPAELQGKPLFDAEEIVAEAFNAGVTAIVAHAWDLYEAKWMAPAMPPTLWPLCTYKASLRVWPDAPSHGNSALRYWLEDQGLIAPDHAKTQPAHRAGPDAYTTAHILKALLDHASGRDMIAWTREPALLPRCPIGKFRGQPWAEVEGGFLSWMLNQPTMEEDLKWNARRELDRRREAA